MVSLTSVLVLVNCLSTIQIDSYLSVRVLFMLEILTISHVKMCNLAHLPSISLFLCICKNPLISFQWLIMPVLMSIWLCFWKFCPIYSCSNKTQFQFLITFIKISILSNFLVGRLLFSSRLSQKKNIFPMMLVSDNFYQE